MPTASSIDDNCPCQVAKSLPIRQARGRSRLQNSELLCLVSRNPRHRRARTGRFAARCGFPLAGLRAAGSGKFRTPSAWRRASADIFARASVAELALVGRRAATKICRAPHDRVTSGDRGERPPLSSAQERVWFLEQLHPGNNAYRFQSILKFHGRLERRRARRCAQRDRASGTRSCARRSRSPRRRPFQQVHALRAVRARVEESSATDGAGGNRPVDPPAVRSRTSCRSFAGASFGSGRRSIGCFTPSTTCCTTGGATVSFLRELFAAYDALAAGREPDLPPLPAQFADLAAWQQRQIDRGAWDAQLEYWEQDAARCRRAAAAAFGSPAVRGADVCRRSDPARDRPRAVRGPRRGVLARARDAVHVAARGLSDVSFTATPGTPISSSGPASRIAARASRS